MKKLTLSAVLFFICSFSFSLIAQENNEGEGNTSLKRTVRKASTNEKTDDEFIYRDFRFTVGGGYAYRMGKMMKSGDSKIDKMGDDLRNGYNIDLEGQYYFKENWGLGLNFYFNKQNATGDDILLDDIRIRDAKESTRFIYVGPTFNTRYNFSPKFTLYMSLGIGPLFFKDEVNLDGLVYPVNKTVFASYVSVSTDYNINNNLGAGIKLSFGGGTVDGTDFGYNKDRVSLSNLMVTGYISFRTSK